MSDPILATLTAARALIAEPGSWCQRQSAKDLDGLVPDDPADTVSRCASQAIYDAARSLGLSRGEDEAIEMLVLDETFEPHDIILWNDAVPHESVLAAFDRAIAAREARTCG